MYVPMFDQIPKGHVRYCHDFVPVVAVRIHSHDSQALVSGKTNQGIINSLNKYTQIPETSACAMIFAFQSSSPIRVGPSPS
jgi:hypothetical protein